MAKQINNRRNDEERLIEARSLARTKYNEDRMEHKKEQQQQQQQQQQHYQQDMIGIDIDGIMMNPDLPKFSKAEIICSTSKLGNGVFGVVYEVRGINIGAVDNKTYSVDSSKYKDDTNNNNDDDDDDDTVTGHRIFMAKHYLRRQQRDDDDNANSRSSRSSKTSSNSTRYAIKRLRSIIINNDDPYILMQGMVDMATETRILCTLPTHPNIIKLRAVGGGNSSSDKSSASSSSSSLSSSLSAAATATVMITPFHEDYFIVLDKLYCTLQEKWLYWKKMEQSIEKKRRNRKRMREVLDFCSKPRLLFTNNKRNEYTISSRQKQQYQQYEQQQQVLYSERINACCDIASAISHLHKHNIIHRDIKPQNIGYNIRGDIVLFDFGLSREIPTITTTNNNDDNNGTDNEENCELLFHLTGYCGTPLYMASEVGLNQLYNEKSDVYSFGILVWQLLTLQQPYKGCTKSDLKNIIWPSSTPASPSAPVSGSSSSTSISPDDWLLHCSDRKKENHNNDKHNLMKSIPHTGLASMIKRTWSHNVASRPSMEELEIYIRNECMVNSSSSSGRGSNNSSNYNIGNDIDIANPRRRRRRSTFIFEKEQEQEQEQRGKRRSSIHSAVSCTANASDVSSSLLLLCTIPMSVEEEEESS